jgi:hypothetical protein
MALAGTKTQPRKSSAGRRRGGAAVAAVRRQTHTAGSPGATGTQAKGPVGR